jgi:hypothetical protein
MDNVGIAVEQAVGTDRALQVPGEGVVQLDYRQKQRREAWS